MVFLIFLAKNRPCFPIAGMRPGGRNTQRLAIMPFAFACQHCAFFVAPGAHPALRPAPRHTRTLRVRYGGITPRAPLPNPHPCPYAKRLRARLSRIRRHAPRCGGRRSLALPCLQSVCGQGSPGFAGTPRAAGAAKLGAPMCAKRLRCKALPDSRACPRCGGGGSHVCKAAAAQGFPGFAGVPALRGWPCLPGSRPCPACRKRPDCKANPCDPGERACPRPCAPLAHRRRRHGWRYKMYCG